MKHILAVCLLPLTAGCVPQSTFQSVTSGDRVKIEVSATGLEGSNGFHAISVSIYEDQGSCSINRLLGTVALTPKQTNEAIYVHANTRLYFHVDHTAAYDFSFPANTSADMSFMPESGKNYSIHLKGINDGNMFSVSIQADENPVMLQSWSVCQTGATSDSFNIGTVILSRKFRGSF